MKQIIWFFGSSASGKKTLIESIFKSPQTFKEKFNIGTENIKVCKEALEWVTKKNHHERPNLIPIIADLIKNETDVVILVKGQTPDLKNNLLTEIGSNISDVDQKIIFVYTEPKEELGRWKAHRSWYDSSMTEENVIAEINYQLQLLNESNLQGIPIICVSGGKDANYQIIDFPLFKS